MAGASGTFSERIAELRHRVGGGSRLVGSVACDQRYAMAQHEHGEWHHPRGGHAFYLREPLFGNYRDYLADYARTVLHDGGQPAMRRSMEHLSDQVEITAPREWGDLRSSGHPKVTLGERVVYDRPPKAARLTAEELKAKSRATMRMRLAEGLTVYFMRGGKVMVIPGRNEPHGLRGRL
jgi:hypothetical protein